MYELSSGHYVSHRNRRGLFCGTYRKDSFYGRESAHNFPSTPVDCMSIVKLIA